MQKGKRVASGIASIPFMGKWSVVVFILIFLCFEYTDAQKMTGISTTYSDSFREWVIPTEDEDITGELRMRWAFQNDWTAWDLWVGDINATIVQKWKEDPNLWEIRCDGIIVTAKTAWRGEYYRWKLSDGKHQINWSSKYNNVLDEWTTDKLDDLFFEVYTYRDGDPRDWVINDQLPQDVSTALKVAMIFLTIHFTAPRI
jgi:hypothetical protein